MIAFGPVPSRRLGRSLGINNIPPKACSYSCVYCQVGRTSHMQAERRSFLDPDTIVKEVREKLEKVKELREPVDYLTFVPDGEPTLDVNLGREIELLQPLDSRIAVITNSSLIGRDDVREELMKADLVSLKVDSALEDTWRRINRPHKALHLTSILEGMLEFARTYSGQLVTETMLVRGVNDSDNDAEELADFLHWLKPAKAYLSIPTRPPAEGWAISPGEEAVNRYYHILNERIHRVEFLIGYEGNDFASTGNIEEDLLSITAVHPMREDAVDRLLARAGADWSTVYQLIAQGRLFVAAYEGEKFYLRKIDLLLEEGVGTGDGHLTGIPDQLSKQAGFRKKGADYDGKVTASGLPGLRQ